MDYNTANQMLGIMETVYPMFKQIEIPEMLVALIGCIIDQYAADHSISFEDMHLIVEGLPDAHSFAHEMCGDAVPY